MITVCLHESRYVEYAPLEYELSGGNMRLMKLDYYLHESDTETNDEKDSSAYMNSALSDAVITDRNVDLRFGSCVGGDEVIRTFDIEVTKKEIDLFEKAYIRGVTCDPQKACEILLLLAENLVTPCALPDVIYDIYSNEYSL